MDLGTCGEREPQLDGSVEHSFVRKMLNLRIWGMDAELRAFTENVKSLQIARGAVELESPRQLQLGEVIGLGYRDQKTRFRVISSFLANANTFLITLECTNPTCLWEEELNSPDPSAPERQERRRHERLPVTGTAVIFHLDGETSTSARLVDVSTSGFYVETFAPAAVGTELKIRVSAAALTLETHAIVRTMHPSIGMGMEILRFGSGDDQQRFAELLNSLGGTVK